MPNCKFALKCNFRNIAYLYFLISMKQIQLEDCLVIMVSGQVELAGWYVWLCLWHLISSFPLQPCSPC
jgi:hypothetical protein